MKHLNQYREYLIAAGYTVATTVTDRQQLLLRVDRDLGDLDTATSDDLAGWLASKPTWSAETRANYFSHINGYFKWAVEKDHIVVNPMAKLRKPKVAKGKPRPSRRELVARLMTEAIDPFRLAARLANYGGLRCCEICRLDREEINEEEMVVHGKGGYVDTLPVHTAIWEVVRDLPPGPVVRHGRGDGRWTPCAFSHAFGRYSLKLLGVEINLHPIRHRFATDLRRAGNDLLLVQRLMRHRTVASTQIYTGIEDEECTAAIHTLPAPPESPS